MTTLTGTRGPSAAPSVHGIALLVVFMLIPLAAFVFLAVEIAEDDRRGWDQSIIPSWVHVRAWWADAGMTLASIVGGGKGILLITGLFIGAMIGARRYGDAVFVALALNGAAVLGRAFKNAIDRPRPEVGRSVLSMGGRTAVFFAASCVVLILFTRWRRSALVIGGVLAGMLAIGGLIDLWDTAPGMDSFPSGHAVSSMALISALIVLAWPTRARWFAVALGGSVLAAAGLSRVYFGLHYTSDVLGGWALALAWVALLAAVRTIYREYKAASRRRLETTPVL